MRSLYGGIVPPIPRSPLPISASNAAPTFERLLERVGEFVKVHLRQGGYHVSSAHCLAFALLSLSGEGVWLKIAL